MGKYLTILVIALMLSTCFTTLSVSVAKIDNSLDDEDASYHIKINTAYPQNVANKLKNDGYDVLSNKVTKNSLELIVTYIGLKNLEEQSYNITILEKSRPFNEIQAERQKNLDIPSGYPTLEEVIQEMNDAANAYPEICKVFDLTTTYDVSPTFEDRHIYAIKISDNVNEDEDEPAFLMVSTHHCREIVTTVIALHAIEQFTSNYGSNQEITNLVNNYEIWISPVWNPDGYKYVFDVNSMWRKNRREGHGVDLNRNYPFGWDSSCAGSTSKSSDTYKGPSAASEPETQTMIAFTNDRYFAKVLDYHSYAQEVLYSYPTSCQTHPFHSFFRSEAEKISTAAGYQGSVRGPSAAGENYEWQIWNNGAYSYLMETHTSFQPSYSSAESEASKVWPATLLMLNRPISLSGNIKDYVTKQPIEAKINILGVEFTNGEELKSEKKFGRYHLFLPPDGYTIEFSAPGYNTQIHEITVTTESAEVLDIFLKTPNDPPEKPTITGPSAGYTNTNVDFSVVGNDPNEDNISYYVDWGDGNITDWTDFYNSGEQITINHSWNVEGQYDIKTKTKDIYDNESDWSEIISIEIEKRNNPPNTPEIPSGPTNGVQKIGYIFNFTTIDPDNDDVSYFIDWDDETNGDWLGPYNSGETCSKEHIFDNPGEFNIKVKAKDIYDNESSWSDSLQIEIIKENNPPEKPTIDGPSKGDVEIKYDYIFESTDQDNDDIFYFIEWGDGNKSDWLGPYNSGESITQDHSWNKEDTYIIRVKTKDENNIESDWSENHEIRIAKDTPPPPSDIDLKISVDKRISIAKIDAKIENTGENDVSEINWSITITRKEGGILREFNIKKEGIIETLKTGENEEISSLSTNSKIVRIIGMIDIKIDASVDNKTFSMETKGFALGRLILIY